MTLGWPATMRSGDVLVRPLRRRDRDAWLEVRLANEQWLQPWEASQVGSGRTSWAERHTPATYGQLMRRQRQTAVAGTHLAFGVFSGNQLCGQVNIGEIVRGAFCSGFLGYWIDRRLAGRGITSTAVALVADHAFGLAGLHRLEANIRPENEGSLAVIRKLGFTEEGFRRRYLAIDGTWRDHVSYALLADDLSAGVLATLRQSD